MPRYLAPDQSPPDRYQVGDVFSVQHGPTIPNVFAWRVIGIEPYQTEICEPDDPGLIDCVGQYTRRMIDCISDSDARAIYANWGSLERRTSNATTAEKVWIHGQMRRCHRTLDDWARQNGHDYWSSSLLESE